jgi:sulfate transport system permease protein
MNNTHGIQMADSSAREDPAWLRISLITMALIVVVLLIGVPVIHVFWQALSGGIRTYLANIFEDPANRDAIFTTLYVAPRAVFLNLLFGISSAWLVSRFKFPGRTFLLTLIDMPFAISPVVVGLSLVLLYGSSGFLGPPMAATGVQVLFNAPALVLATTFVTLPFIVRELIPVMESIGPDEELAALSLGANGFQIFLRITLPNLTLGLLYGTILCTARAVGEFGAIYVVSGRIAGRGQTIPLRVEQLFQQYQTPADFALASILTVIALATLMARKIMQSLSKQNRPNDQTKGIPS